MKNLIINKARISAGTFQVSVGTFDDREISIISKYSGEVVQLKQTKISKNLRKVKRLFKNNLNSNTSFTFSFMTRNQVVEIIKILRTK